MIGFYFFVEHAPDALTQTLAYLYKIAKQTDAERLAGGFVFSRVDWAHFASEWATMLAALALILRARGVGRLFAWLREAGLRKPETAEEAH